jgi:hypothetical protein
MGATLLQPNQSHAAFTGVILYLQLWFSGGPGATAPIWNMAIPPMMRRRSNSASGFSSWGRRSRGFRRPTSPQAASCGSRTSKRVASLPINTATSACSPKRDLRVGGTQETAFRGAIAHLAIWNRLLSANEIASIWNAGANDLRDTAMYHSYA